MSQLIYTRRDGTGDVSLVKGMCPGCAAAAAEALNRLNGEESAWRAVEMEDGYVVKAPAEVLAYGQMI